MVSERVGINDCALVAENNLQRQLWWPEALAIAITKLASGINF